MAGIEKSISSRMLFRQFSKILLQSESELQLLPFVVENLEKL
jgi:hypothetical protein